MTQRYRIRIINSSNPNEVGTHLGTWKQFIEGSLSKTGLSLVFETIDINRAHQYMAEAYPISPGREYRVEEVS